ncbi:MAG TPA: endonuclease/exonuclease/phosphatase family protein [Candidatus Limnocylindrales bacterium]|nr:endonuclease/exonuclease/phosphatase family protein [Candidatus Limnocylindrales bacterium]
MRRLAPLLAVLAVSGALAVVAQLVVRAQTGPLPLAGVFEIHLLAGATILALVALLLSLGGGRRQAWIRLAMLGVIVLTVVRAGGELWSPPPVSAGDAARTLTVLTWNLELGSKAADASVEGIAAMDADLVALQELTPVVAAAIEADAALTARYPYRILEARDGTAGLGLLARRPLLVRGSERDPLILRAGLLLEDGRTIEVLNVHPYPPGISLAIRFPVGLDTRRRDEDLSIIAARADAAPLPAALVVGDLNATPAEAGIAVLTRGLTDAHEAVGTGPGFTWRPGPLEGLRLGLLRLDHVLSGAWLTPVAALTDCSLAGDHCRLLVTLRVEAPSP